MTKWERFGDDTWINVDHVEVVRVEEQEDGRWELTAAFASGRTYPIGSHEDREMLAACTDALLRDQVSERLLDLTDDTAEADGADKADESLAADVILPANAAQSAGGPVPAERTKWWRRLLPGLSGAAAPERRPEAEPVPS